MQIQDLKRVNELWHDIYPCLVSQVMEVYARNEGTVLELGPFAGGISIELARNYPRFVITVADERREMLDCFEAQIRQARLENRITTHLSGLDKLDFPDKSFDLVVLRGAFFFLPAKPRLLGEIYRVLKPGGTAFVGGGYSKTAAPEAIDAIADESRVLNDRLGRQRLAIETLSDMVKKAGLASNTRIWEEGGVWLVITR